MGSACSANRQDDNNMLKVLISIAEQHNDAMKRYGSHIPEFASVVAKYEKLTEKDNKEAKALLDIIDSHYSDAFSLYEVLAEKSELDANSEIIQSVIAILKKLAECTADAAIEFKALLVADEKLKGKEKELQAFEKNLNEAIAKGKKSITLSPARVTNHCLQWPMDGAPAGKFQTDLIIRHVFKYTSYVVLGNSGQNTTAVPFSTSAQPQSA